MKTLLTLSYLILLLTFNLNAGIPTNLSEKFDPSLARLDNLEGLEAYIDSLAKAKGINPLSKEEVMLVNSVLEDRFSHGYSYYSLSENFLAYLAGKLIWGHLGAIVIPDDILNYPTAACSQQSIVMMRALKNMGYKVRKLGLNGHFVLEVYYNNDWHLFDPNKETRFQGLPHDKVQKHFNNGANTIEYVPGMTIEETQKMFSIMEIGKVNQFPAVKARWFHRITKLLSVLVPLFLFVLPFYYYEKRKDKKNKLIKYSPKRDRVLIA